MCGISVNTLHQKFGQGCTEPSALRSIGPQLPASSHLHVASRTELAEVLLLTQPTQRAERKLQPGKIHKAAGLAH